MSDKRKRVIRLGKQGLKLREIHEKTGASTARISEILRDEGVKSNFYVQYEQKHGKPLVLV